MAQERCVRKTYQQSRLWLSGEVRTAPVDDRGNSYASNHFRLLEDDEKVDEADVFSDEKVKKAKKDSGMRDKKAAINNALNALDHENDSHWTQGGAPALQAVFQRVDFEVSRADVTAANPGFERRS
jgi:hypothetical protein